MPMGEGPLASSLAEAQLAHQGQQGHPQPLAPMQLRGEHAVAMAPPPPGQHRGSPPPSLLPRVAWKVPPPFPPSPSPPIFFPSEKLRTPEP